MHDSQPPVPVIDNGDREANVHRLTADCTSIIERWVRDYPEAWSHDGRDLLFIG